MRYLLYVLLLGILFSGCKKNKTSPVEKVEFYLLQSYKLVAGKCQVDAATAVLEPTPLVSNDDILYYTRSDYEYTLTDTAYQKLKALVPRTPFAVTLDKKIIYYAIHMPSILSSSCDNSITMDYGLNSKVFFRLGYPGVLTGATIDDQRNNKALMTSLAQQGKLK